MLENVRVRIIEIAEDLEDESTQHILLNVLGMRRVNVRFVPIELNPLRKLRRLEVAKEMLTRRGFMNSTSKLSNNLANGAPKMNWN